MVSITCMKFGVSCSPCPLLSLCSRINQLNMEVKQTQGFTKDGLSWLIKDHEKIRALFVEYDKWAASNSISQMKALVDTIIHEISIHASGEERYVYPYFRDRMGETGRGLYEKNIADDNVNKEILSLLEKLDPVRDADVWRQSVDKIKFNELDHMSIEEGWFAALRPHLSQFELEALEDQLIAARSTAPTHPHARVGPSHEVLAKITHPIASFMDKAKDKLAGTSHQPTAPVDTHTLQPSSTGISLFSTVNKPLGL